MRFRTEIEPFKAAPIDADAGILLLGSCFADNVGCRLAADGFRAVHNPLGPMFNPISLARTIARAADDTAFTETDLTEYAGMIHALDAASRFQACAAAQLLDMLADVQRTLVEAYRNSEIIIATFGTAFVYTHSGSGRVVANCHKLPDSHFSRTRLSVQQIVDVWQPLLERMKADGKRVLLTVSPVRHVADGLHANNLSKATLLLAAEQLNAEYFPAYEIVCDDLRDYRFYAPDLKHPSEAAVEYIYEKFADTYFTPATKATARERHAEYLRAAHRPNLPTL